MPTEPTGDMHHEFVPAARVRSIWAEFTDPAGLPASPQGCVILLALATSQRPSRVSAMDMRDLDFENRVWHAFSKHGLSYPLHLTRLALALIGHALSHRRGASGTLVFPSRVVSVRPMTLTSLSRAYRRAVKDTAPQLRRKSDIPVIAAWIMAEAGVENRTIRAVVGRLDQGDIRAIVEFYRFESWVREESRIGLECLEASLMRIAGLTYADLLFRPPADGRAGTEPATFPPRGEVQGNGLP